MSYQVMPAEVDRAEWIYEDYRDAVRLVDGCIGRHEEAAVGMLLRLHPSVWAATVRLREGHEKLPVEERMYEPWWGEAIRQNLASPALRVLNLAKDTWDEMFDLGPNQAPTIRRAMADAITHALG